MQYIYGNVQKNSTFAICCKEKIKLSFRDTRIYLMKLINMFNLETATQMWRCDVLVMTTILNFIQLSLSSGLRSKPCLGRVRDWRW